MRDFLLSENLPVGGEKFPSRSGLLASRSLQDKNHPARTDWRFGQALYAGLRLQAGRTSGRNQILLPGERFGTLYGIAGSLNGRTPVDPFILSLGYVDNDSWKLQFTLGRPIPEGSVLDNIH